MLPPGSGVTSIGAYYDSPLLHNDGHEDFSLISGAFLLSICVSAQRFSAGVKVGAVTTDTFKSNYGELTDESKLWTIGPSFEMELWRGLGIEIDALYRHAGFDAYRSNFIATYTRERDRSWEFPTLAKYRKLPASTIRPFVLAGYAPRTVSGSAFGDMRTNLQSRITRATL